MPKKQATRRPLATKSEPLQLGEIAGSSSGGVLVAVELGGQWPYVAELTGPQQRRVLSQREGESPADFANRVGASLDGAFGKGVALAALVLACNERCDDAAESARRKLGALGLGAMAKQRAGKVYLAAAAAGSGRVKHSLTRLAQGLHDEWRTAGLEVTVDFGAAPELPIERTPFAFTARVA